MQVKKAERVPAGGSGEEAYKDKVPALSRQPGVCGFPKTELGEWMGMLGT